jgi:hypothetical protein
MPGLSFRPISLVRIDLVRVTPTYAILRSGLTALAALAEPGGISISRAVQEQIRDKVPYAFEDSGEQQVKNITRPVRVYICTPRPPPVWHCRPHRR